MSTFPGNYERFKERAFFSMEEICLEIYRENRDSIKTKKEAVAVKNLILIFEATLKLSIEKGFHATSLRDLCRETGLSMGGLYSYFSGKDHILSIILQQGRRIVKKMMDEALEDDMDLRMKLHSAVKTHLYLSEVMHQWFFFSYMETRNLKKEEHKNAITGELYTENIFINILEEGKADGYFSVEDSTLSASVIKAMLQDWYLKRWKYNRRGVSVDRYAEFIISVIDTGLCPEK